jgi:uncharacterized protein involved in oxidation of intracellular sulfur
MKLGIVIHSTDPEVVWNGFRLGVHALAEGDEVKVFLLASGVEAQSLDTDQFPVSEQMRALLDAGGEILACGSCLTIRDSEGGELCPMSNMAELHRLIAESDKVISL